MRVFSASLATETNTFSPLPTGLASFKEGDYFAAGQHPDRMTLFSAPLWAARLRGGDQGWDLFEGLVATAQPGGATTRSVYETLRDQLLADLRAACPVDMVLLGLHGAMVADGYDDCEGDLLGRVRAIVGPDVVVGAELDPHNHLTPEMVAEADLLIAFKEYPHSDALERALELVDLCAATVARKIRPVAAVVDCDMIVTMHTTRPPARGFVDRIQSLEGKAGVLSISISHGFAWGDVAEMGTKVLVYTDGDAAGAFTLARQLGDELIAMRESLAVQYPDIDSSLDEALAVAGGPVVLADGADNPGGGAACDSTFILQRMIERGVSNAAIGPLWDPIAVRLATAAGVGARLPLRIGGKVSPMSGAPLDLDCSILALQADMEVSGLGDTRLDMGDCALVEAGGIAIVLVSRRIQCVGPDLFMNLGCDPAARKIVVVKSSQHFYTAFSKLAAQVIYTAAPGSVSLDLTALNYRKARRPKWPLDN